MIKLCLKKFFSTMSLLFCTVSMVSAWGVEIADGRIKCQTEEHCDIRQGKKGFIPVRLNFIFDNIIDEILNSPDQTIVFYEYFRVNNVNYKLIWDDEGDCEKVLYNLGIVSNIVLNYYDIIDKRDSNAYNEVLIH